MDSSTFMDNKPQSEGPADSPKDEWIRKIGPATSSVPAQRPTRTTLRGITVTLKPLREDHAVDLFAVVGGQDRARIWTYMPDEPFLNEHDLQDAVKMKSTSEDPLFFAIIANETAKPVGWASFMRIDTKNRVVEIGHVLLSPTLQRTRAATEALFIMAKHAFDDLGYRRLEWKCDNLNQASRRAATRLGYTFEGVFRQHVIYKGRSRDTAWFSILDTEWPAIKMGIEKWLDDANFDSEGKQLERLQVLSSAMPDQTGSVTS